MLAALNPANNYFICFDQLDLGFSTIDDKYNQRLTGLLIAARDLFVAEVLGNGSAVTWDQVFDESPDSRMPSRQSKYQHICDRTLLRPRDMIKFCNEVLKAHKRDGAAETQFENRDIHAARDAYSDYLLNEIDDEIAKHVPAYKDYLEVLKVVGSEKFEFRAFADAFDAREELAGFNPLDALSDLFTFSVISYLRPGGRGGGSEYVWRYKDPRARFDSNIDSFKVHPGFKEVLGLTR